MLQVRVKGSLTEVLYNLYKLSVLISIILLPFLCQPSSLFAEGFSKVLTFGATGTDNALLKNPYGVAVDQNTGDIYIADTGNNMIKRFDPFGNYLNSFGGPGTGNGEFYKPQGIAYDNNTNDIYIVDTVNHRIQKFHVNGDTYTFILTFGEEGKGDGQFFLPRDIALDTAGNIYVLDSGNHRIQKFAPSGVWQVTFDLSTWLLNPYGIDVDTSGNIYVADTFNNEIIKFAPDGEILLMFGTKGTGSGEFMYPRDVAVDPIGNIFVADTKNYRIQKFDSYKNYINSVGGFVEFLTPQKLAIDSNYRLYVIDSNTNKLQIYNVLTYITDLSATPNPFSPDGDGFEDICSIHYIIPEPATMTIKIYDQDNNLIRDLVDHDLRGKPENIEPWDGKDNNGKKVVAGTYICKIDAVNGLNYNATQQSVEIAIHYPSESISGIVTDGAAPISSAIVRTNTRYTATDLLGRYTISNLPSEKMYRIFAIAPGCISSNQLVFLYKGKNRTNIDFSLKCSTPPPSIGEIYGKVTDNHGPVKGATVTDGTRIDITDPNGMYRLIDIPIGTYWLKASRYQCGDIGKLVELTQDNPLIQIDFALNNCQTDPDIRVVPTSLNLTESIGGINITNSESEELTDQTVSSESKTLLDQIISENEEKEYEIQFISRSFTPERGDTLSLNQAVARVQTVQMPTAHILIQLFNIPTPGQRETLKDAGIELLSYIPNNAWFSSIATDKIATLSTPSTLIRWIGVIQPTDKISPQIQNQGVASWGDNQDGSVKIQIKLFKDVSLDHGKELITGIGGKVLKRLNLTNVLTVIVNKDAITTLANSDIVQWIEDIPPPPRGFNDSSRKVIGADIVQSSPYNLTGKKAIIGVWDEGHIDPVHDDFGARITFGDVTTLISKHATHVAGTLGGSGLLSETTGGTPFQWKGMAPESLIISYDWNDPTIEHNNAINSYHIDVSQNSWGWVVGWNPADGKDYDNRDFFGNYTAMEAEYDSIVTGGYGKRVSIVFAAGNDRGDVNPNTGVKDPQHPDGFECLAPPGTAKNIITVGAVNSDDDTMTTFSNWGPVDDFRIKPDIVAPGAQKSDDLGVTSTIPGDAYASFQGTSMAAPAVSGALALMIEEYKRLYNGSPFPSTLKGILLHTADDLGNIGPDYKYGFGRIDLSESIDIITKRGFIEGVIPLNGEEDLYTIEVKEGTSGLKITLAWDDPPGELNSSLKLVNDLDLLVRSPDNIPYSSWCLDPWDPGAPATRCIDHINNIEQVYVTEPKAGIWKIKVKGTKLPYPGQTYSLISEGLGLRGARAEDILTIYNDGTAELKVSNISTSKTWLSVAPNIVTVLPISAEDITVIVDSAGLNKGTYYSEIEVLSNDPDQDRLIIPVIYTLRDDQPDTTPPIISSISSSVGADTDGEYNVGSLVRITVTEHRGEIGLNGLITITSVTDDPGITDIPLSDNNDGTYTYDWDTTRRRAGEYRVNITLTDPAGNKAKGQPLIITLASITINQAPVLDLIGNKTANPGQPLTFTISAEDPNGDWLSYSVENLPEGASFDAGAHAFTWLPLLSQIGSYPGVRFEVTDGELTDREEITIIVSDTLSSETATWTVELNEGPGDYDVFIWYPISADFAPDAIVTITHANGSDTIIVDQGVNGGKWVALGRYPFTGDVTENISVSSNDSSTVVADAVKFQSPGIVDNNDPGFSVTGMWGTEIGARDKFGSNYRAHIAGTGTETATWRAELYNGPGLYEVLIWYPVITFLASNAPFTINHGDTTDTVLVDQSMKGGEWVSIGIYYFEDNGTEDVTLSDNANSWIVADAVRFKHSGVIDNVYPGFSVTGTWGTDSSTLTDFWGTDFRYHTAGAGRESVTWEAVLDHVPDDYEVFVWYPVSSDLATNAPYTIHHANESDTIFVDQSTNGGQWISIGTYSFTGNGAEEVTLTDKANSLVVADAVRFEPAKVVDNINSGFSVHGTWGTYNKTSGLYGKDYRYHASGTGAEKAIWSVRLIKGPGRYRVFVWYPENSDFATNAEFTITHAQGSDTILVNQSINGGKWVDIGSYDFNDDGSEYVTLSDKANSWVVADAMRFEALDGIVDNDDPGFSVKGIWINFATMPGFYGVDFRFNDAGSGTESVTWEEELINGPGAYEVFVRYTKSIALAPDAEYTITHANGSDTIIVDQRLNGGQWVSIGTYTFADDGTGGITLSDNSSYTSNWIIADAVKFVPSDLPKTDGIIDNRDSGFGVIGTWETDSTWPGFFGQDYRYNAGRWRR